MPASSTSLATLRPDLAGCFTEFDIEGTRAKFAALSALRLMDVAEESGTFGRMTADALAKYADAIRNPGSGYGREDFTFTSDTYLTREYGWETPVDDRQAKIYRHYFDAELIATRKSFWKVHLAFEKRISDLLMNTSTFGSGYNGAVAAFWSNVANAKPITDVNKACVAHYNNSGFWPNAILMSEKQFKYLILTNQIVDRLTASGAGEQALPRAITIEKLKQIFDLQHVFVGGGSYDSAPAGLSSVMAEVWPKDKTLVFRVAETDDIEEPCLGRTMHWGEDGSMPDGIVEVYREENKRSNIYRVRRQLGEKLLYTKLGYLLTNVLDTTD